MDRFYEMTALRGRNFILISFAKYMHMDQSREGAVRRMGWLVTQAVRRSLLYTACPAPAGILLPSSLCAAGGVRQTFIPRFYGGHFKAGGTNNVKSCCFTNFGRVLVCERTHWCVLGCG